MTEKSIAHAGPQSEYNPRCLAPDKSEIKTICDQMAEMERKYQESAQRFAREWRDSLGIKE